MRRLYLFHVTPKATPGTFASALRFISDDRRSASRGSYWMLAAATIRVRLAVEQDLLETLLPLNSY